MPRSCILALDRQHNRVIGLLYLKCSVPVSFSQLFSSPSFTWRMKVSNKLQGSDFSPKEMFAESRNVSEFMFWTRYPSLFAIGTVSSNHKKSSSSSTQTGFSQAYRYYSGGGKGGRFPGSCSVSLIFFLSWILIRVTYELRGTSLWACTCRGVCFPLGK